MKQTNIATMLDQAFNAVSIAKTNAETAKKAIEQRDALVNALCAIIFAPNDNEQHKAESNAFALLRELGEV